MSLDLQVSTFKTEILVVGYEVKKEELLPMTADGGSIERVAEFPYLGSLIAANSRLDVEVDKGIPCVSN